MSATPSTAEQNLKRVEAGETGGMSMPGAEADDKLGALENLSYDDMVGKVEGEEEEEEEESGSSDSDDDDDDGKGDDALTDDEVAGKTGTSDDDDDDEPKPKPKKAKAKADDDDDAAEPDDLTDDERKDARKQRRNVAVYLGADPDEFLKFDPQYGKDPKLAEERWEQQVAGVIKVVAKTMGQAAKLKDVSAKRDEIDAEHKDFGNFKTWNTALSNPATAPQALQMLAKSLVETTNLTPEQLTEKLNEWTGSTAGGDNAAQQNGQPDANQQERIAKAIDTVKGTLEFEDQKELADKILNAIAPLLTTAPAQATQEQKLDPKVQTMLDEFEKMKEAGARRQLVDSQFEEVKKQVGEAYNGFKLTPEQFRKAVEKNPELAANEPYLAVVKSFQQRMMQHVNSTTNKRAKKKASVQEMPTKKAGGKKGRKTEAAFGMSYDDVLAAANESSEED